MGSGSLQSGGNREKLRNVKTNILLYFTIEMGQRGGNHYRKGREAEVKVMERGSRRHRKWEF